MNFVDENCHAWQLWGDSLQSDLIPGQLSAAGCVRLDDDNNQGYLVLYLEKMMPACMKVRLEKKATEFEVLLDCAESLTRNPDFSVLHYNPKSH